MRLSLLALACALLSGPVPLLSGCDARAARADGGGAPAPAPPPTSVESSGKEGPAARVFKPESVRLPENSPTRKMLDALEARRNEDARKLGEAALGSADAVERGRLLWLLARADSTAEGTRTRLTALHKSDHLLARWAGLRLGEALLQRTPDKAVPIAEALDSGWAGASRARQLLALSLYKSGDYTRAEPILRELIERSGGSLPANLALPLTEILAKRRDLKGLKEALSWARKVGARAVQTENGARADDLAKEILQRMPKQARLALATPSLEEELARGEALMNARNYDAAFVLFDKLAKRERGNRVGNCKAELQAGKALFSKRDRPGAAKRLAPLAERCKDPEIKAWSRYYAASARQRTGDPRGAIAEYEALVKQAGAHSLADDALSNLAVAYQDAGDDAAMRKTLERVIERYPSGDMRSEARFSLMLAARTDRDYAGGLAQIDRMLAEGTSETSEGFEGRTPYWRARTLQDLGRMAEAKAGYVALARALPLSYYAQQSLARLGEIEPASVKLLLAELEDATPLPELTFRWRSELSGNAFQTALELLRLGELSYAKQELTYMGAMGERADREMSWLIAALMNEVRAHTDAVNLARVRLRGFRSLPPRGRARQLWRVAYPRAYEPLIERAAEEAGVPPEFVRAIAREESSFSPSAVSSALAYGLIQLIRPTARIYAGPLRLPHDPESLKRPEINLRIGAALMRDLWTRYAKNPAIVPSAYNAGHGASDRWLAERGDQPLDEWVERIPYRETRRYMRRVLQTYGVYCWLDTGKLPPLPAKLPPLLKSPAAAPPAVAPAPQPVAPAAPATGPSQVAPARGSSARTPSGVPPELSASPTSGSPDPGPAIPPVGPELASQGAPALDAQTPAASGPSAVPDHGPVRMEPASKPRVPASAVPGARDRSVIEQPR